MEVARHVFEAEARRGDPAGPPRGPYFTTTARPGGRQRGAPAPKSAPDTDDRVRAVDLGADARAECARLDWLRRLAAGFRQHVAKATDHDLPRAATPRWTGEPAGDAAGARWAVVRRNRSIRSLRQGLVCVFIARVVDDRGSLVEERPVVLHVALDPVVCARDALERLVPVLLDTCRQALEEAVLRAGADRVLELRRVAAGALELLTRREIAIGAALGDALVPVQVGLFDRRAARRADADRLRSIDDARQVAAGVEQLRRRARVSLAGAPELLLALGIAD
jgi:hypothetical protein